VNFQKLDPTLLGRVSPLSNIMATTLERQDSFKTSLRNQKRRLSSTKQPSPGVTNSPKGGTPIVGLSPRNSPIKGMSPRNSPNASKAGTPEISTIAEDSTVASPCPSPRAMTPVPQDSPLLHPRALSPCVQRARSFNKDLRRAASFRAAKERSCSRNSSAANSRQGSPEPAPAVAATSSAEVSFSIKRALGARKGWKIMTEDGESLDSNALRAVVGMIKDIEYQGLAVPERITIRVP